MAYDPSLLSACWTSILWETSNAFPLRLAFFFCWFSTRNSKGLSISNSAIVETWIVDPRTGPTHSDSSVRKLPFYSFHGVNVQFSNVSVKVHSLTHHRPVNFYTDREEITQRISNCQLSSDNRFIINMCMKIIVYVYNDKYSMKYVFNFTDWIFNNTITLYSQHSVTKEFHSSYS